MFNLLRMDLRRLFRGKMLYICLASAIMFSCLVFYGVRFAEDMEAEATVEMSAADAADLEEAGKTIAEYTVLFMVQESIGASGVMAVLCLAILQVLVIEDFESGIAKGLFATYRKRWKYMGSKLITGGIISLVFLIVNIVACVAINGIMGSFVTASGIKDILLYVASMWLVLNAFNALILLISVAFRNKAISITAEILFGLGIVVSLLRAFLGLFKLAGITEYTLYQNMAASPITVDGFQLKVILISVFFLIGYAILGKIVLDKADI